MYYQLLLLDAVADYDVPYIYKSEEPLEKGQLVLVPFGLGNTPREALVLGQGPVFHEAKKILRIVSKPLGKEDLQALFYLRDYYATPPAAYARLFLPKALRVEPKVHWVMREELTPQEQREYFSLLEQGEEAVALSSLARKEVSYRERITMPKEERIYPLLTKEQLEEYVSKLPVSHHGKRAVVEALLTSYPYGILRGDLSLASLKRLEEEGILRRIFIPKSLRDFSIGELKMLPELSPLQEQALQQLVASTSALNLFQGVSASGKSYVYLHLAKVCLEKGKKFILLLPEGSLIPAMVEFFRQYYGKLVGVYHSQLSQTEEKAELLSFIEGNSPIMITTRKGLFLPLEDVEMMVLDECQDDGYLSKHPYFHGVELASFYGRQGRSKVIFASATPPLSLKLLEEIKEVLLNEPFVPRQLETHLVDMRRELSEGNKSSLSRGLYRELTEVVKKKGLAFLLMNKRLYASYIFCRSCGEALRCPRCNTSLSYDHQKKKVVCAACNYEAPLERRCPHCGSTAFRYYGGGLQQVVEELRRVFPGARVLPLDAVTMRRKLGYKELHRKLVAGEVDILVGTPLIARGFDFDVDLLGVINADFYLHLPNYRSGEKTYELLSQFLGRGGRRKPSKAFVQTYEPQNYVLNHVLTGDTNGFLKQEAMLRKSRDLPPFSHYILLRVHGEKERVEQEARDMAEYISQHSSVHVSEPYGQWTPEERKILLSSKEEMVEVKELLLELRQTKSWKFTVEVDPLSTI